MADTDIYIDCPRISSRPKIAIEACQHRAELSDTPPQECVGCNHWQDYIPEWAEIIFCDCGVTLLSVNGPERKCPKCGARPVAEWLKE